MTPFAHWITPTFAPKRFDTWFFLAEAPEDQVALHDGSESTDSVWIGAQEAIDEATAGKRTLVHATQKNLELLAEGGTVAGALAPGRRAQDRHGPALGRDQRTASATCTSRPTPAIAIWSARCRRSQARFRRPDGSSALWQP